MMKTLLPAPLLSVALFLLWLLLNRSFSSGQILLGALLGLLLPLLLRGLRPLPVRVRHPLTILRLALRVVWDTSVSNFNVVRFMLFPGMRKHPANFVRIPLELRDPNGLAVLAAIMCVIPGTIWSEMALDRSALLVHIFDLNDPDEEIRLIKARYERPLMEIFE